MAGYDIEIQGLAEMQRAFDEAPKQVGAVLEKTTKDAGKDIQREAVKEAPHYTGNLQRSMHMEYTPIQVLVEPTAEYAKYVEFGTAPHPINPQVLEGWAKKKGLNPYIIARSIRTKGTKANPFMGRTRDNLADKIQQAFADAANYIAELLSK